MILDTNALSAKADGDADLEPLLKRPEDMAVPAIVLGEYKYGVRQSRHRARYEGWLSELIADCRVLAVDERTAEQYAGVRDELKRRGRPIPGNDVWIAVGPAVRAATPQPRRAFRFCSETESGWLVGDRSLMRIRGFAWTA